MKESEIRKKAFEVLEKDGWYCWYPKKVRYQETDVFGVFDILALKGFVVRWIQITSLSNIRARERKIMGFLKQVKAYLPGEVWGYDKKKKIFKIIYIPYKGKEIKWPYSAKSTSFTNISNKELIRLTNKVKNVWKKKST